MPTPELIALLAGPNGVIVLLVIGLMWMTKQWHSERKCAQEEKEKRNQEALLASHALTEQKMLNLDAKHQIEMRDYRLGETQQDLTECKQELLHYRHPKQAST